MCPSMCGNVPVQDADAPSRSSVRIRTGGASGATGRGN